MELEEQLKGMMASAQASRVVRQESRRNEMRYADFEGVVSAIWKGIGPKGAGLVEYKGKTYTVINEGTTMAPKGRRCSLEYRNGVYVAWW